MCIIALCKPGAVLKEDILRGCASWNRDGIGVAYINPADKKVQIDKQFETVDAFIPFYRELIDAGVGKYAHAVHFRFATVGGKGLDNCQPFPVKGGAMMHNGTFFGRGQNLGGKSDTRIVAERMYNNFALPLMKRGFKRFEQALGYNRVVFLYDGGEYFITNENTNGGLWNSEGDIWFSNPGFRPYDKHHSATYSDKDWE